MRFFLLTFLFLSFLFSKTINFAHVVCDCTPKGQAALYFAKRVKELSNGKLEVRVFANQKSEDELFRKFRINQIQMIAPAISKFSKFVPSISVLDLPLLFKNMDEVHKALEGDVGKYFSEKLKEKNFVVLAYWDNGFKQITNNLRPIRKPEDLKGLRVRIMPSRILAYQYVLFGAKPVVLPFSKVYYALKTHQIDGEENTLSNIYSERFYRVQKYLTISNHGYLGYIVAINRNFWNNLSEKERRVIKIAIKETTQRERRWAKELNEKAFIEIKKSNIKINYIKNREEWKKILKKAYIKYKFLAPEIFEEIGSGVKIKGFEK